MKIGGVNVGVSRMLLRMSIIEVDYVFFGENVEG